MRRSTLSILTVLVVFSALALSGCVGSGKRLNLDFKPQGGLQLTSGVVQLVVVDNRASKNLVGPEATSRELLKESQPGILDLTTTMPNGTTISLSHLSVPALVFESIKNKLASLGVTANPDTAGAKARVTVYVTEFVIDVEGNDYVGRVAMRAVIDRPGIQTIHNTVASAQGSKFKLVGDMGANDPLTDALNKCVNALDFSGINTF
ncbi:MAG: hypothetical protein LBF38_05685 [Deltaproteobacteria bacterium]|jgi:hypothetical protein|nr:hypothetical protein [Deltaproteobacteria bacterium]